jgi:hypothetical protein
MDNFGRGTLQHLGALLMTLLRRLTLKQRGNPVQIVVNAERGVAEALRLRSQCAIQRKDSSSDATKYENHL